ncbi:MAG: Abi family protein [Bacilli bacterium]|nr:Abi family protein [Bacilli bacterium]
MYNRSGKEFKNLEEQIEILEFKGLIISNYEFAKEVLLRENYFFLNGYRHLFMKSENNKRFIDGTTFEELYSLFLFDRQFRNVIFKNLLIIENNVKSVISYQLSLKYGYKENDYLKEKNFTRDPEKSRQVNDLLKKMKRQVRSNANQHAATMHYVSNYGYIPLWVLVKVLSFGIVGELFSILKREDQEIIANMYNMDPDELINNLPILSNYRNLCAHEDIVFENKTQRVIEDTIYHQLLKINKMDGEYIYGKNDLFALIILIKQMLKDVEFKDMVIEIDRLLDNLAYNLKTIPLSKVLDRMGFPENWEDIQNIKKRVE